MRRREFIGLLGGAAAAWPLAARAQQPAMPVIGFSSGFSRELRDYRTPHSGKASGKPATSRARTSRSSTAGRKGNTIGCRRWRPIWSAGRWPSSPRPAARRGARGQGGDRDNSDRLHIGDDPSKLGLVASLNRPGGNATGDDLFTAS